MEFKDYKEKQAYYRERAKQVKTFWVSCPPLDVTKNARKVKNNLLIRGKTYIKDNKD